MPDFSTLIDLLNGVIYEGLTHERKKAIMLQLHEIKTYSRQEKLADLTLTLLDIEDNMGFGKSDFEIESERLEALVGRLDSMLDNPAEQEGSAQEDTFENNEVIPDNTSEQAESGLSGIELTMCNCNSRDEARDIARGLVESKLAACVNIIANIGSIYQWQGEIVDTSECQLQIKSSPIRRMAIQEFIQQHHSNEIPEIIHVPINHGNVDYLTWVLETTKIEAH